MEGTTNKRKVINVENIKNIYDYIIVQSLIKGDVEMAEQIRKLKRK